VGVQGIRVSEGSALDALYRAQKPAICPRLSFLGFQTVNGLFVPSDVDSCDAELGPCLLVGNSGQKTHVVE
jgi:hypothetical protein